MSPRRLAAMSLVAMALAWTTVASADAATAEALFREGRALLDEGKLDAACSKLAESQAQEASSGTLLNLALCHEKQGKLAAAWAEYVAAARLANAQGKAERADVAARKASELEPRLPRLTIRGDATLPGLEIMRGHERLGAGALGSAAPVDPGSYTVTATAHGHRGWTTTIEIVESESKIVDVPTLEVEPSPASVPDVATEVSPPARSAPIGSFIVGGAGVAVLGVGVGFGLASLSTYGDANRKCSTHQNCDADARSARDRAEVYAWVANIGLGLGVIGLAIGTYLFVTGRGDARTSQTTFDVTPLTRGAALDVSRAF